RGDFVMDRTMEKLMSLWSGKSFPRGEKMTAAVEGQSIVLEAMRWVPHDPHDNKGSLLAKAARALSLSYWQAKKLRYGEVTTVDADKLTTMREQLQDLKEHAHEYALRLDALVERRNALQFGE